MALRLVQTYAIATLGILMAGVSEQAIAATMTATLTADNHYALFTGNKSGTEWNFIGRNEKGSRGIAQSEFVYNADGSYNPTYIGNNVISGDVARGGKDNWSMPETWTYDINKNDYLYVVAWDDGLVAQSWIGQFVSNELNNGIFLSKTQNWEFIQTVTNESNPSWGSNPGDNGNTPEVADLSYQVATANAGTNNDWSDAIKAGDNVVHLWGDFSNKGISSEADFLDTTTDTNSMNGGNNQQYTIFRTIFAPLSNGSDVAKTPEPSFMLGITLFGLLSLRTKLGKLKSK